MGKGKWAEPSIEYGGNGSNLTEKGPENWAEPPGLLYLMLDGRRGLLPSGIADRRGDVIKDGTVGECRQRIEPSENSEESAWKLMRFGWKSTENVEFSSIF